MFHITALNILGTFSLECSFSQFFASVRKNVGANIAFRKQMRKKGGIRKIHRPQKPQTIYTDL